MYTYNNRKNYNIYNVFMQQKDNKTSLLAKVIGETIKELRTKNKNCSLKEYNFNLHDHN